MKLKTALAVTAVSLFAATGIAQAEKSPVYVTLGAGVNYLDDQDFSALGVSRTVTGSNPYWAIMGAVGVGVFNNFRVELEGSYRAHGLDSASGRIDVPSAMLNVYYDIPLKLAGFTPYIGAGAGASWISADNVSTLGAFGGTVDDTDQVWSWQGIVGVAADLAPNWKLTVDYRYLGTFEDPSFSSANHQRVDGEFSDHTLMVGFRYSFGAPPPPAPVPVAAPAPAPAPAPAEASPLVRSFLVFFDFNRSDITDDARKVINQAADNARKAGGTTRINLTGHADRSGSAQYNLRLSQRRADAVKAELVKLGVPAGDITTVAKGETDPLVPTADGVREPRNRRVEIVF